MSITPLHLNKVINMIPSKNIVEFIDHILNESAIIYADFKLYFL